ncbi:FAD/NAD(P)-binding domain-containing protein [Aspergillus cavernicola]|uniref:FAD/NAD(P)-binding domain-containing protein n=1 Tax=Aspergillus cavernicola TaxID=176166 RepID=A0ABR4HET6_9EURO
MIESQPLHVAIIGAGFAGLRCADILIQNGAQVTIFEARDRVGGRVHQSMVGDHLVDMGPNWIHGTGTNPIVGIAEATGTGIQDFEGTQVLFGFYGEVIGEQVAMKISEFLWTTIQEAFEYSNNQKEGIPADRSFLDFFRERLEERTGFSEEEKRLCVESCRLWGSYVGSPVERQSLRFFRLEECIDGNNYFVASTYKDILNHVSRAALQHADIRFNQPIVGIKASTSARREVTLTTATDETHTFDEVVVTCPLGWLKHNKSAFTPELPPRLSSAIDSISYGRLEKIYVTFPSAFWQTTTTDTAPGTTNNLTFAQFLNPTYTTHPEDILWNQECFSLAALHGTTAQPTLLFYTYGPCGTHVVNHLTSLNYTATPSSQNQEEAQEAQIYLKSLLEPFYSRLPNFTPSSPSCIPLSFTATTWQTDPYAGFGSYSNFQTGLIEGDRDIEVLRKGMGAERGIWFAGEHTAPFVALGTTTGAFWSGERVAGEVCMFRGLGVRGMGTGRDDSLPSCSSGSSDRSGS